MRALERSALRTAEIVDVDVDPREQRRRRRRAWLRIGLPVGTVLLMVGAIIGIASYSYFSNRRDALALSRDVLVSLDQRVVTQLQSYLTPAIRVLNLIRWVMVDGVFDEAHRSLAERLSTEVLRNVPQLANVTFGNENGDFLMLRRTAEGAVDTKTIERAAGGRRVNWIRRDPVGRTIAVEEEPADTYDPRTRPWFQNALQGDGVHWTDVYIFFTDRKPGITASLRMDVPAGEPATVVGVDIGLDALSVFLDGLKIGRTGRAMIIDKSGRLVAYPDPARMMREDGGRLVPARLDEIGDPLLTRAFDRLRVEGPGQHVLEVEGARYIIAATPLREVVGRDWSLVFVVPEDDFVGFVASNNRTTLLMSIPVVALAVVLAALLAYQGLRADSNARLLRKRQRVLEAQGRAFTELAASAALFDVERTEGAREVTSKVATALGARRASLWRLKESASALLCEDCYDQETKGHSAGAEFVVRDCPQLFEAVLHGDEINVADAALDPRTADLHRIYLQPVGCRSLLAVSIRQRGRPAGSIWIEDGDTFGDEQADALTFARAVAGMLSARFAEPEDRGQQAGEAATARATESPALAAVAVNRGASTARSVAPQSAMRTASLLAERSRKLSEQLVARGLDEQSTAARIFPDTSVLVLRFLDPAAIAERPGKAGDPVMIDGIVRALQQIAAEHGIDYLKILNDQIVAAQGFLGDAQRQAVDILDTALAIQDYCAQAFTALGRHLCFTIGIDTGAVIGSSVGFGGVAYNVWGEALRVASAMAASAPPGAIQVTESTYRHVFDRYLFLSRGAFYLEAVGELSTYLLKAPL